MFTLLLVVIYKLATLGVETEPLRNATSRPFLLIIFFLGSSNIGIQDRYEESE